VDFPQLRVVFEGSVYHYDVGNECLELDPVAI
jgi:hypothetical protein